MRPLLVVLLAVLLVAPSTATAGAANVATPVATQMVVTSEAARSGGSVRLSIRLVRADSAEPLAGERIVVRRWIGAGWTHVGVATTDADGVTSVAVDANREPTLNRFAVDYAGSTTGPGATTYAPTGVEHHVRLVRRNSRITLAAPQRVVDERRITLRMHWRTGDGVGAPGHVKVQRRVKRDRGWGPWRDVRVVMTGKQGRAQVRVRPRHTTRWRVVAPATAWARGARSGVRTVRNVPPAPPVAWPRGAPRPRITLPKQRRAVGAGANPVVRRIDQRTWRSMVGRSWHHGCPVGRNGLRLVEVNYFDFDGYRRRGQMVVAAGATSNFVGAFRALYDARIPIRSMYRVDRFGWSRTLGGADDYRSMAAGNTSVFNCRGVVGNPGVRSPHSYGRSLDLNPWENPYHSRHGWTPNRWWASRSHPRVAWTSANHRVVRILGAHGFRWTYGHGDQHHFDAVGGGRGTGALLTPLLCGGHICH